jgi:uncharacterized protein
MKSIDSGSHNTIRFAVNFSEPAEALLQQEKIQVDLLKCPAWPHVVARARSAAPVYVHFPIHAGRLRQPEETVTMQMVEQLYLTTETPHVNIHLDPQVEPEEGRALQWERVLERTVKDVAELVSRFGARHIVVENVPFWKDRDMHFRLASEPWFIRRVLEETGAGLLLDLAHARIAAKSLGLNEREYISALPLERLRELHVTGIGERDGWLRDHLPMSEEDWQVFDWAAGNICEGNWGTPRIIAFEYGGVGERFAWRSDPDVLAVQVPRLFEGVANMSRQRPPPHKGHSYLLSERTLVEKTKVSFPGC